MGLNYDWNLNAYFNSWDLSNQFWVAYRSGFQSYLYVTEDISRQPTIANSPLTFYILPPFQNDWQVSTARCKTMMVAFTSYINREATIVNQNAQWETCQSFWNGGSTFCIHYCGAIGSRSQLNSQFDYWLFLKW